VVIAHSTLGTPQLTNSSFVLEPIVDESKMSASEEFRLLLKQAELRFGKRSRKLKIKVESRTELVAETVPDGDDACVVYYAREAKRDPQRLRFQLAHEAIHVLSGALKREALKFEEGLAVWFSLNFDDSDPRYSALARGTLPQMFSEALDLFEQLGPTDEKIKELRSRCNSLDGTTPELLQMVFSTTITLAERLCERVPADMHLRR
jgi:hypothetical protein